MFSFNIYAEGYLCSYKYEEQNRKADFKRVDNHFIKKLDNKNTKLSILHESSKLIILGELLSYEKSNFLAYFTVMIDKEKNEFIGNAISLSRVSPIIGGSCIIY
jgi:hypothetical protein